MGVFFKAVLLYIYIYKSKDMSVWIIFYKFIIVDTSIC